MVSNWILNISIGCLLLISIGLFYEMTVIFYIMFNWWIIILLLALTAISSLVDRWQKKSIDNSELPIETTCVEPIKAAEQYTLFQSISISIAWLIPIVVDLIFSSVAVFIAYLLNDNLNLDDVYFIGLTPSIILFITCLSTRFREMLSNNFNSSIYSSFGAIGIVTNTFVVEWGGYLTAKTLGM
jgi:hypothetical protein